MMSVPGVLPGSVPEQLMVPVAHMFLQKRGGFNSEILHVSYEDGGKRMVEKRIGAKREDFSRARATQLADDILVYQEKLEALSVPIPALKDIAVKYDTRSKKAVILVTTQWTGPDAEMMIGYWMSRYYDAGGLALTSLVRKMWEALQPVLEDRVTKWETAVGIDPKASNFTADEFGKVWYVDPFPPRFRKEGVPLLEWKPLRTQLGKDLAYFKYFDVRGIVLGFIEQLARIRPDLKELFEEISYDALRRIIPEESANEFLGDMHTAPWTQVRAFLAHGCRCTQAEAEKMLHAYAESRVCGVRYSIYTLREIALELARAGIMSGDGLEEFFALSHFEEEFPRERMGVLVSMLGRALSAHT